MMEAQMSNACKSRFSFGDYDDLMQLFVKGLLDNRKWNQAKRKSKGKGKKEIQNFQLFTIDL